MSTPRIPPPPASAPVSTKGGHAVGNMYGSAFVGTMDGYLRQYGKAAAQEVISRLSPQWRRLLQPHAPSLGILGARKYPYAFIGELLKCMAATVKVEEDVFLRQAATWGVDATLDTVSRIALRYVVSPQTVAERSPELWRVFHDCGRLTITSLTDHDFLSEVSDWPHHDVVVCKLGVEGGRRIVERTGAKNVEARREKCQAWGHDVCLTRIRWA